MSKYMVETYDDLDLLEEQINAHLSGPDYVLHGPLIIRDEIDDGGDKRTLFTQVVVHSSALPHQASAPSLPLGPKEIQAAVDRYFAGRRTAIPIKPRTPSW